jgi:hypothetical protein
MMRSVRRQGLVLAVPILMVVVGLAVALGWGTGKSSPKDEATRYYAQIYAVESELANGARAKDVEKIQKVLADGETIFPKVHPPRWAQADHALLTQEWARLASDMADARDDPGAGFEAAIAADVHRISVITARLAAAASAHRNENQALGHRWGLPPSSGVALVQGRAAHAT